MVRLEQYQKIATRYTQHSGGLVGRAAKFLKGSESEV